MACVTSSSSSHLIELEETALHAQSVISGQEYMDYPAPTQQLNFQNSALKGQVFVQILPSRLGFKSKC